MDLVAPEPKQFKKIGEIWQDLEDPEARVYIVMRDRCYQFNAATFQGLLVKYATKNIPTDSIGVPLMMDGIGDEEETWHRWQNRDNL